MARAILMAAAEEERLKKHLRLDRRVLRQASKPLMLPDKEFVAHFRLHKTQFQILCADVIPLLKAPQRSSAVLPEIKVLAGLAFYVNGCYQKNVGAYYHLGLSQTVVSDSLRDVTEALNDPTLLRKYIYLPVTRTEREAVARGYVIQTYASCMLMHRLGVRVMIPISGTTVLLRASCRKYMMKRKCVGFWGYALYLHPSKREKSQTHV